MKRFSRKKVEERDTKESRDARRLIKQRKREALIQDLALLGFLSCVLGAGLLIAFSEGQQLAESVIMFLAMCICIVFAAYRFQYIAVVIGGMQTFAYVVYKVYLAMANGDRITPVTYAWLVLPLLCLFFLLIFLRSAFRAETEMEIMDARIKDMILVEPVTGLYNLKSMYVDIERQISYSRRNKLPFSLMLIELRYPQLIQAMLTELEFDALKQKLAEYVEDRIRLEDRIYATDQKGSLGLICTCDKAGAQVVMGRLRAAIADKAFFTGITNRAVRIEIRIGCYEYNEEIKSAMELKQRAENELQYDV